MFRRKEGREGEKEKEKKDRKQEKREEEKLSKPSFSIIKIASFFDLKLKERAQARTRQGVRQEKREWALSV